MEKIKHHITSLFFIVCYYLIISIVNWSIFAIDWSEPSKGMFATLSVATIIIVQFENKYGEII